MTRIARIIINARIEDPDVTVADLRGDLDSELGSSTWLGDRPSTTIEFVDAPDGFRWRGSHASARELQDFVHLVDAKNDRAGHAARYATAEASIETTEIGFPPIRVDHRATCTVDAYDGVHMLKPGDALIATADGWRVAAPVAVNLTKGDTP